MFAKLIKLPPVKGGKSRILPLDGVRGVAVLLVLFCHVMPVSLHPFGSLRHYIANVLISTGFGVQMFFVLSGFLITGILVDLKGADRYYYNFYARRALRILPLYYLSIVGFGLCVLAFDRSALISFVERLPFLLTFTLNWVIGLTGRWVFIIDGHSLAHFWSLAVEEQFYLIWPLVVAVVPRKQLALICCSLIVFGLIFRSIMLWHFSNWLGALTLPPGAFDALGLGSLLAVLVRDYEDLIIKNTGLILTIMVAGGGIWILSCLDMNFLGSVGLTGFVLMSGGLLVSGIYTGLSRPLSHPVLRSFGKYSYAIYVLHVLILPFLRPLERVLHLAFFIPVFIGISWCAGWLSWNLLEKHFDRLKSRFPVDRNRMWQPGATL